MSTAIEDRQQAFYSKVRNSAVKILDAANELLGYQGEFTYGVYGTNLIDGTGVHEGLTKTDVGPAVFDFANALKFLLDGGHGATLTKLR